MSTLKDLEHAEMYLGLVREKTERAQHELEDMRAEYKRMNAELPVKVICNIIGRTSSTVHRKLKDGTLKSKRMRDVLEYVKKY
jgi:hypothetical protein